MRLRYTRYTAGPIFGASTPMCFGRSGGKEKPPRKWKYLRFNCSSRICLGRGYPISTYIRSVTTHLYITEQYELVEASYMIVRALQHFAILDTLDVDQSPGPKWQTNMILAHLDGVHVRLHSPTNCNAFRELLYRTSAAVYATLFLCRGR